VDRVKPWPRNTTRRPLEIVVPGRTRRNVPLGVPQRCKREAQWNQSSQHSDRPTDAATRAGDQSHASGQISIV
jgi:hypothetical protein